MGKNKSHQQREHKYNPPKATKKGKPKLDLMTLLDCTAQVEYNTTQLQLGTQAAKDQTNVK